MYMWKWRLDLVIQGMYIKTIIKYKKIRRRVPTEVIAGFVVVDDDLDSC